MWQIIRDLSARGVTIFLTTQYLEEADQLADRIAVLDHGRLVAEGTPGELKRLIPGGHIRLQFGDADALAGRPGQWAGSRTTMKPARWTYLSTGPSGRSKIFSAGWTSGASPSGASPCTRLTWTTCSSPSPAALAQKQNRT